MDCRILISDRSYTGWHFADIATYQPLPVNYPFIDPAKDKLFSTDTIRVVDNKMEIIVSAIRNKRLLPGVLLLENGKTYGRNSTKKRLLYKCIPDDRYLPAFLIPYEVKLGFNKSIKNRYIVFQFDHWNEKHPHGIITENLGEVGTLDAFYEYQIYCRHLNTNITEITNKTKEALTRNTKEEYIEAIKANPQYKIKDMTGIRNIFSIDPLGSVDYDDAFSIVDLKTLSKYEITIYIANVYVWLETLGLWKSFSKRVSTIYLPDRRRPMLPTILSDNLCSLQKGQPRFAFAMKFCVGYDGTIERSSIEFTNAIIRVDYNYAYDSVELLDDPNYHMLRQCTNLVDKNIVDSHELVAFWMIQMNMFCGEKMASRNIGIFRYAKYMNSPDEASIPQDLSKNAKQFIMNWKNTSGQYGLLEKGGAAEHQLMKIQSYIHITSPIRRLVDLLNQIWFMREFQMVNSLAEDSAAFLDHWIDLLDYVNTTMRSIRKVQNDCSTLAYCHAHKDIADKEYTGVIFDRIDKNDGTFTYMVYLDEIGLVSKIVAHQHMENYSKRRFQLYLFEDEFNLKKKIKLKITNE